MGVIRPDQAMNQLVSNEGLIARWTVLGELARTLKAYENNIEITCVGADGVLTMPDVVEAAGQYYFILAKAFSSTTPTVVLSFPGDPLLVAGETTAIALSSTWVAGNDLTATDDYLLLYSTGLVWIVLGNVTT